MSPPRGLGTAAAAVAVAIAAVTCSTATEPQPATDRPVATLTTSAIEAFAPPTTSAFKSTIERISTATARRMSASWRPGCPVPLDALRLVTVTHWGLDGRPHQGELVIHAELAGDIVSVFRQLHEARFPVAQMRLVDDFDGDDNRSMAANNTSAFNCRRATGSDRWSEHAYGRAVDINPVQNPYVTTSGSALPPAGAAHTDRDPHTPGLIGAGGPVVAAFARIGWGWGGAWSSGKDYQHFSASGR